MFKHVPTVFIILGAWLLISVVVGVVIGLTFRRLDHAARARSEPMPAATRTGDRRDDGADHGMLMRSR